MWVSIAFVRNSSRKREKDKLNKFKINIIYLNKYEFIYAFFKYNLLNYILILIINTDNILVWMLLWIIWKCKVNMFNFAKYQYDRLFQWLNSKYFRKNKQMYCKTRL